MVRRTSSRLEPFTRSPMNIIDSLLVNSPPGLIRLHAGEPSLPPPLQLANDLLDELRRPEAYAYAPNLGIHELREAISEDLKRYGASVAPEEVAVTPSGSAAIYAVLSAIVDPGDEVVLLDPTFMLYRPVLEYLGVRVRWLRASLSDGFQPSVDLLSEAVTDKTKAVVIVDPDNPTGRLLSDEARRALAELAEDRGFYLLVDEAYRSIVYEGAYRSPYNFAPDSVVGLGSFSKDPGVPGLRVGYVYGPSDVIKAYSMLSAHAYFGASNASQLYVLKYLRWEEREAFIRQVVDEYRRRRDAAVSAAREFMPQARFIVPQGAMYLYVDVSYAVTDSEGFALKLVRDYRVSVMPGTAFGPSGNGFIRITFVSQPPDRLREGIRRIGLALAGLGSE